MECSIAVNKVNLYVLVWKMLHDLLLVTKKTNKRASCKQSNCVTFYHLEKDNSYMFQNTYT